MHLLFIFVIENKLVKQDIEAQDRDETETFGFLFKTRLRPSQIFTTPRHSKTASRDCLAGFARCDVG